MATVVDLTHTSHCPVLTGVQRVSQEVFRHLTALDGSTSAIIYDRYAKCWRSPDVVENARLHASTLPTIRNQTRQNWTFWQQWRGRLDLVNEADWAQLRGANFLAPEIFGERNFRAYAKLRSQLGGAAGAVFHDAVALRLPHFSQPSTVARFPAYLRELTTFDGIAANSKASQNELLEQWDRLRVRNAPPVVAIPLGVEPPATTPAPAPSGDSENCIPLILSVGTIEGRKNQISLIEAAEILWREGRKFRLVLAGMLEPRTGAIAWQRARELKLAARPIETTGAVSESRLQQLYTECRFTVYPSRYEGFGLPAAESLLRHRPCLCGPGGALAEVARGGGCYLVPSPTIEHLAHGMRALLDDQALYQNLVHEAAQRRFPTWRDYAREISAWLSDLPPRPVNAPTPAEKALHCLHTAEKIHSSSWPFFRRQEEINQGLIHALQDEAEGLAETTTRLHDLQVELNSWRYEGRKPPSK
jgi:glycosyltransferase involved in cell wall biosynthesis